MITCPKCAHAGIAPAARFCPECGGALAPPAAPAAPPATTIDVKQDVGNLSGGKATGVEMGGVTGPVTVNQPGDTFKVQLGNVGSGSQVAVGRNISQAGAGAATYSAADRAALSADLERVATALTGPDVPADRQLLGAEFLRQLQATLLSPDAPPDAATVQVCGDWLLNNVPVLRPALVAALTGPAGARALAAAGEAAVSWGRAHLGTAP
jgi:hypothetical protein